MDIHDKQRINSWSIYIIIVFAKLICNFIIFPVKFPRIANVKSYKLNEKWNRLSIRYDSHKWNSTVFNTVCQLSNSREISFFWKGDKICKRWINVLRNCVDDICIRASTRPNSQSDRWGRKIFSDSPYVSMGWYPLLGFLLTQHME